MGSSASLQAKNLDYAEECVRKGIAARDRGNLKSAQRFFEEALKIREEVFAPSADVNYAEPYVSVLILVGETHLYRGNIERALYFLLRASDLLDPKMDLPSIRRTTAVTQFVNVTAGLVLVCNRIAMDPDLVKEQDGVDLRAALAGFHPLDLAESQLHRAIEVVSNIEGTRSATLIPLFHMLARVLMSRRRAIAALRVMQRCLGLTLHFAQTKQIFSFLSYTRNVLDAIKRHAEKDSAAIKIQHWFRETRLAIVSRQDSELGRSRIAMRPSFGSTMPRSALGMSLRRSNSRAFGNTMRSPETDPLQATTASVATDKLASFKLSRTHGPRGSNGPPVPPLPPLGGGSGAAALPQPQPMASARTHSTARTVGSSRSRGDRSSVDSPPALPHSPQRSGSFRREVHEFDLPDILGMNPNSESPTPTTIQTSSAPRETNGGTGLPGEIEDPPADAHYATRDVAASGHNVYSTLNYVNRNITTSMRLWQIPDDDDADGAPREASVAKLASAPTSARFSGSKQTVV